MSFGNNDFTIEFDVYLNSFRKNTLRPSSFPASFEYYGSLLFAFNKQYKDTTIMSLYCNTEDGSSSLSKLEWWLEMPIHTVGLRSRSVVPYKHVFQIQQWYHMAFQRKNNKLMMIINDEFTDKVDVTGKYLDIPSQAQKIWFGQRCQYNGSELIALPMDALISEFRVSDIARYSESHNILKVY